MNARDGTPHIHGCLNCRPDMVPDFTRDDPRYHDGEKCLHLVYALLDGADPGYTTGIFEGPDGWVLSVDDGYDTSTVHQCSCGEGTCAVPRFGNVEARHHCPAQHPAAVR
jgi:hypothetical protein